MYKIELEEKDLNIVMGALQKQPYELVYKLIASIFQQAKEQESKNNN